MVLNKKKVTHAPQARRPRILGLGQVHESEVSSCRCDL